MNLTLSINEKLLKDARKAAVEMDTSVNALVREYLKGLVQKKKAEQERFFEEWQRLMDEHPIETEKISWNRNELHER
jgi:hypothetical protein